MYATVVCPIFSCIAARDARALQPISAAGGFFNHTPKNEMKTAGLVSGGIGEKLGRQCIDLLGGVHDCFHGTL